MDLGWRYGWVMGHGQHDHRFHRVVCLKLRRGPSHCNPASDRWRHVSMQIVELELDLGLRQTLWLALWLALWLLLTLALGLPLALTLTLTLALGRTLGRTLGLILVGLAPRWRK